MLLLSSAHNLAKMQEEAPSLLVVSHEETDGAHICAQRWEVVKPLAPRDCELRFAGSEIFGHSFLVFVARACGGAA